MTPTDQLKAEHEGIKLMLRILEKVCAEIKTEKRVNEEQFSKILEFFKVFADKCHHGKEEDLLFPVLEEAGIPKQGGPIGVMLLEHAEGRSCIKGMSEAFEKYKNGDKNACEKIAENAQKYILILTGHIEKENNVLFPWADKVLFKAKQEELNEKFEELEVERIGAGKHEEFHKLLHQLKEIYLD